MNIAAADVDHPQQARRGDADWLSLALMDARNHTLRWLAAFESVPASALRPLGAAGLEPPAWLAGHAAWWQEWWITRHVQTQRGEACDARRPRLASIDPRADALFDPGLDRAAARWSRELPSPQALRDYMAGTLEAVLELLAGADGDDALHFPRLALWLEDRLADRFAEAAQALGLPLADAPIAAQPARAEREAIGWPAQRMRLGTARDGLVGLVPPAERGVQWLQLPEFEIDAQPVNWLRFAEFVEDGGYDERRFWTEAGWAWVQAHGRRAPHHVEQLRGGVLLQRFGRMQRAAGRQAAVHLTQHEAHAWCRWAGRRLPLEAEWELAATRGGSRGFVWGDVFEWTAGRAEPWAGADAALPPPGWPADAMPDSRRAVLRGAAWTGRVRQRLAQARRFADPSEDSGFTGFRSCAA